MRPKFRLLCGLVVFLLFVSLTILSADKKRKASQAPSKAKATRKTESKQQARTSRNNRQDKNSKSKQQLAKKKQDDKKGKGKKNSGLTRLTARQQKSRTKDKTKRKAAEQASRAKKTQPKDELKATTSAANAEIAKGKISAESKNEDLPQTKLSIRPIAKVTPRSELKFDVSQALANPAAEPLDDDDGTPDIIDVIEYDSVESIRLSEVLRSQIKPLRFSSVPSISRRKIDVGRMDAERISQIQEALSQKGYYTGEITGRYDQATIDAMRKFQEINKVDVTGYATAQSLRLLGLTDW